MNLLRSILFIKNIRAVEKLVMADSLLIKTSRVCVRARAYACVCACVRDSRRARSVALTMEETHTLTCIHMFLCAYSKWRGTGLSTVASRQRERAHVIYQHRADTFSFTGPLYV